MVAMQQYLNPCRLELLALFCYFAEMFEGAVVAVAASFAVAFDLKRQH